MAWPKFRAMAQQHSRAAAATPSDSFRLGIFAVTINTAHISFRWVWFTLCGEGAEYE
jgi:hypothetical protein